MKLTPDLPFRTVQVFTFLAIDGKIQNTVKFLKYDQYNFLTFDINNHERESSERTFSEFTVATIFVLLCASGRFSPLLLVPSRQVSGVGQFHDRILNGFVGSLSSQYNLFPCRMKGLPGRCRQAGYVSTTQA